ncbi:MAG: aldo/keto reductase [Propionibacteriaceae bacterium]|nr:aldo/keto reductase [Propionibacteriaceae bacterium]
MRLNIPSSEMNDGKSIPQLGFGTYLVPPDDTERVVAIALQVGYRHIDTAALYGNERGVGAAIAASDIPRDELFITTKLWNDQHEPDKARAAINASLEKLGLDHVDLYLIHWPSPRVYGDSYIAAWDELQEFKREGLATSIGVSNFNPEHLDKLRGEMPAVNQVELHPSFTQVPLRDEMARRGILIESWSPLGRGSDLKGDTVAQIADDTGHTPAQVVIRWHLQHGFVVIPKSVGRARIEENSVVFDFELTQTQMDAIDGLNRDDRHGADPVTADF